MGPPWYNVMLLSGVGLTAFLWWRAGRRDRRLPIIFGAALVGAFAGAKIVYLLAEGWNDLGRPDTLLRFATGKTILGSLLFGYPAVEIAKKWTGYSAPTGDRFAVLAPLGIGLGRVGCWLHGCCQGQVCQASWYTVADGAGRHRWPSVPLELAFQMAALAGAVVLRSRGMLLQQHFHLYLVGYGIFRFLHEFVRDTPRILGPLSGYHFAALAVAGLGAIGFHRRRAAARRMDRGAADDERARGAGSGGAILLSIGQPDQPGHRGP